MIGHGYRTWMFGAGLATLDGLMLDMELFYVASLLHDYGLSRAVDGEDFTLRSAADSSGAPMRPAWRRHRRRGGRCDHGARGPGATVERDGALGVYVQAGAMFDLTACASVTSVARTGTTSSMRIPAERHARTY